MPFADGCHHCGSKGPLYDVPDSDLAICEACRRRFGPCDECGTPGPTVREGADLICVACHEARHCPDCGRRKRENSIYCDACEWHAEGEYR